MYVKAVVRWGHTAHPIQRTRPSPSLVRRRLPSACSPVHQLAQICCLAVIRGQHHGGVRNHDCRQLELVAGGVSAAHAGPRHNGDAQAAAGVLADLQRSGWESGVAGKKSEA